MHNGGRSTLGNEINAINSTEQKKTVVSSITTLPVLPEADSSSLLLSSVSTLRRELLFVFRQLTQVALNESAWNYLRGLYDKYKPVVVVVAGNNDAACEEEATVVSIGSDVATIVLKM